MHLPQEENLPVLRGQRPKGGLHLLPQFRPLRQGLGGWGGIGNALLGPVQGVCGAASLPAQNVHGGIGGQAVEPGGEACLSPEAGQALPRGEKRLLGRLLPVLGVPAQAAGQGQDRLLIAPDQLPEGLPAAPAGLPQQDGLRRPVVP